MNLKHLFTIILFASFAMLAGAQQVIPIKSTDVQAQLKKDKNWVILDVRTADEFKEGHIKGAINIDIKQSDALTKIDKLDHNAKYIVHCRTNHRSKIAVDHMAQSGFKTVYQMIDGWNGWLENNLEVQK